MSRYSSISPIFVYQPDILSRYFESPDISAEYHLDIRDAVLSPEYQAGFERSESGAESTDSKLHYTHGHAENHAHAHVCGEDVALRGAAARRGVAWRGAARRGAAAARARRDLWRAEALRAFMSRASRTAEAVATRAPHIAHEVAPSTCRRATCGRLRRRRRARFRAVVRARVPSFVTACGAPR